MKRDRRNRVQAVEAAADLAAAGTEPDRLRIQTGAVVMTAPSHILPRIAHPHDAFLGRVIGRTAVPGS